MSCTETNFGFAPVIPHCGVADVTHFTLNEIDNLFAAKLARYRLRDYMLEYVLMLIFLMPLTTDL